MNERIKELAEQAGLPKYITREIGPTVIQKFAELIVQECVTKMALEIMDEQWVDDAVKNTYKHFGVEE